MKTLLAIVVVLSALGCKQEKSADCKTLVQTAGPLHANFLEVFGRSDQPPSELETQAVAFEKGAADLNALALKDETVKALATEYAGVFTQAAAVRRDMAAASGALDPAAAGKAQVAATNLMMDETRVKAKMNTTCN